MVRQAHYERNQYITVRPEPVEGLNQRLLNTATATQVIFNDLPSGFNKRSIRIPWLKQNDAVDAWKNWWYMIENTVKNKPDTTNFRVFNPDIAWIRTMITHDIGFTRDFSKKRCSYSYTRLRQIPCGIKRKMRVRAIHAIFGLGYRSQFWFSF